jgi:hypothetical protein
MTNTIFKNFIVHNVTFIQRKLDKRIDATIIFSSTRKRFANWYRRRLTQQLLKDFHEPVIKDPKFTKHTWVTSECIPHILEWIFNEKLDFEPIQKELDKPFPEEKKEIEKTHKKCAKCKRELELTTEFFYANKNNKDKLDRRCKLCYKEERQKNKEKLNSKAIEYYNENKEKLIKNKSEWNKKNKDKVNAANRRAYAKKMEKKRKESKVDEISDTISTSLTLTDKKDNPYQLICRESDGYINVTSLCKAGRKKYNTWSSRDKTTAFLRILEKDIGIVQYEDREKKVDQKMGARKSEDQEKKVDQKTRPTKSTYKTPLIKVERKGKNENRATWVHPRVAINIAQWLSPKFDVQVSGWVHKLMVVGHVRVTDNIDNKSLMCIQKEQIKLSTEIYEGKLDESIKTRESLIKKLNKLESESKLTEEKYNNLKSKHSRLCKRLKRQDRVKYKKGNCIYVVTNKNFKGYKVGITNDLVNRMSSYNTGSPEDYDLKFHKYTIYNKIIEDTIKVKYSDKLHSQNKEWYIIDDYEYKKLVELIELQIHILE